MSELTTEGRCRNLVSEANQLNIATEGRRLN